MFIEFRKAFDNVDRVCRRLFGEWIEWLICNVNNRSEQKHFWKFLTKQDKNSFENWTKRELYTRVYDYSTIQYVLLRDICRCSIVAYIFGSWMFGLKLGDPYVMAHGGLLCQVFADTLSNALRISLTWLLRPGVKLNKLLINSVSYAHR